MGEAMTCWSCLHYRPTACALALRLYPNATPRTCERFCYEPGSDEEESAAQDFGARLIVSEELRNLARRACDRETRGNRESIDQWAERLAADIAAGND